MVPFYQSFTSWYAQLIKVLTVCSWQICAAKMTLEQMSANLSKWLDNHPDCSEGPFHFTHTSTLAGVKFHLCLHCFEKGARGRGNGGKGKNSQILGQSHSLCKEWSVMKAFWQTVSNAKVSRWYIFMRLCLKVSLQAP